VLKPPVTALIQALAEPAVLAIIHFNDQLHFGREEVSDVPAQHHLTPKLHTKPTAANSDPEQVLRRRGRNPHIASTLTEHCPTM
jgi:hypothetical protein